MSATLYTTSVAGDGKSPATAFRPFGFDGLIFGVVFIDPPRSRCMVISNSSNVTGTGITKLLTNSTREQLAADYAKAPSNAQRTQLLAWCASAVPPYAAPNPTDQPTWGDCLTFIARQVEPDADPTSVWVPEQ